MALFTDPKDIETLREAGRRLAFVLDTLEAMAKPGVSTKALDERAEALIRERGDVPALFGYKPSFAKRAFPATICISVNNEVVHGIPNENPRTLKDGDVVGLDLVLSHEGVFVDSARTIAVGAVDSSAKKLLKTTEEALYKGIDSARVGGRVGDIGYAISEHVERNGFSVVTALGGHGVGRKIHEDPNVPNYGKKGAGALIKEGMVLAIEPIVNEGAPEVYVADDEYTYLTKDGKRSAHFEHTVLVTKTGAEVITKVR